MTPNPLIPKAGPLPHSTLGSSNVHVKGYDTEEKEIKVKESRHGGFSSCSVDWGGGNV